MNKKKITNIDLFVAFNILFFIWMCYEVYYSRFIHYRGSEYVGEFFIYAALNLFVVFVIWKITRHFSISNRLLFLIQFGILIHFAGGLLVFDGTRLYDLYFFGIRFDKYVHIANSFISGLVLYTFFFKDLNIVSWIKYIILISTMLGFGTIVEIVEYLVTLTIETNGVGDYDNNLQDMISNLIGTMLLVIVIITSKLMRKNYNND